jgi:lipid-A-disaccharide synthase
MKLYFVAGERSGDLHGGNLIRSLRSKMDGLYCRGFGGDNMMQAGMEVVVHYREMAFMGFAEVIANLTTISRKLKQCKQDMLEFKPDAVVLIDYAGFNLRIARFAKQHGIKVIWYISPKVWAWNQGRALKLKACIDRMFVILPFEKEFFRKYDWDVDYVGNPVFDAVRSHNLDTDFFRENHLSSDNPVIALLPGSRKQEVSLIIPVMAEVAGRFPDAQFAVASVDNLSPALYEPLRKLPNVKFVTSATYDLLAHAHAAIVTSGTATLETALFKVPQVVVYRASPISYLIAKSVIRVPFISLVNLLAGREVVKELIQHEANASGLSAELEKLLNDKSYRLRIMKGYNEIIQKLDTGSASENLANLILDYLEK